MEASAEKESNSLGVCNLQVQQITYLKLTEKRPK
jgi:hypothetical protein